jgi:hypothetical protein
MFGGLSTENAGVALAAASFSNAVAATRSLINFVQSSTFGPLDENRFGKIATFEFMFLNNHWINRESRVLLAEPLRNEVNTFLMVSEALRIGSMVSEASRIGTIDTSSQTDKNVAMARLIQGQDAFDERFTKFPARGPGESPEVGSLFYEFAKHLGQSINLNRHPFFLAAATGSAMQSVTSLKARKVLGKVRLA